MDRSEHLVLYITIVYYRVYIHVTIVLNPPSLLQHMSHVTGSYTMFMPRTYANPPTSHNYFYTVLTFKFIEAQDNIVQMQISEWLIHSAAATSCADIN